MNVHVRNETKAVKLVAVINSMYVRIELWLRHAPNHKVNGNNCDSVDLTCLLKTIINKTL